MLAFKIDDTRDFMKKLLTEDVFDAFDVSEASVTTFTTFHIDGSWHGSYFAPAVQAPAQSGAQAQASGRPAAVPSQTAPASGGTAAAPERDVPSWQLLRPYVFGLIRGRHTPLSFKIVLRAGAKDTARILTSSPGSGASGSSSAGSGSAGGDVSLFLNISFGADGLLCTTGTARKSFSLDKTCDRLWEDALRDFFRRQAIAFHEL